MVQREGKKFRYPGLSGKIKKAKSYFYTRLYKFMILIMRSMFCPTQAQILFLQNQNLTYELFPSPTQNHIHPSLLIIEMTKRKPFSELRKKCDFAWPVMIRIKENKDSNYPWFKFLKRKCGFSAPLLVLFVVRKVLLNPSCVYFWNWGIEPRMLLGERFYLHFKSLLSSTRSVHIHRKEK